MPSSISEIPRTTSITVEGMSLEQNLRHLVAEHGIQHVHTVLNEFMRKEYEFLSQLFEKKDTHSPTPAPTILQESVHEIKPSVKNIKVKVRKAEDVQPHVKTETEEESKFRNPNEVKEFQKAAVDAKHAELTAAGIKGESLLTQENLNQWLVVEGNTYAWVAREKTGCSETRVADVARSFGIKSAISRRREESSDS